MNCWQTTRFDIDLAEPRVMGIVNVTPDSFSDGGAHATPAAALRHCEQLLKDGADILDIGGESTRPGSPPLPLADELARVLPVLAGAVTLGVPVSVDTYKAEVMQAALDAGADIVNDVWALRQPGAAQVVARHGRCGVCLMHMYRDPQTMQAAPMAGDAVPGVLQFLQHAAHDLRGLGVEMARIVLDPGIGFGKTVAQNFALLARQGELLALGYPLLAGWSRKSALGAALQGDADTPPPPAERVAASVAAALLAVERGARIVRVHDVRETAQALAVWRRVRAASPAP
ncbi:dihydropteroate synthase [Ottowia pentelensis]|uniref:Dihydropteroate synthase n=1 Tax=Ottowia pentelensis TaxID=511108 RepID=A0ABV6PMU5_9BURK